MLHRKGKHLGGKGTRGKYSKGKSVPKRDRPVYSRQEAGHWEVDTMVRGQSGKAGFAALTERKTRFSVAVKIPDGRAETMGNVIVSAPSVVPPALVKSITCVAGGRSAATEGKSESGCTATCILPIPTVPGKRVEMRSSTACSGRSVPRAEAFPALRLPR